MLVAVRFPRFLYFLKVIYFKKHVRIRARYQLIRLITIFPALALSTFDVTFIHILEYSAIPIHPLLKDLVGYIGRTAFIVISIAGVILLNIGDLYLFFVLRTYKEMLLPKTEGQNNPIQKYKSIELQKISNSKQKAKQSKY